MVDELLLYPEIGAKLKIGRAKKHIDDIKKAILNYLAQNPASMTLKWTSDDLPKATFIVNNVAPVPAEIALMLGDAVHNLRAALDVFVYALLQHKTNLCHKIAFPFSKDKKSLGSKINECQINLAGPEVIAEIYLLEPYTDGGSSLGSLHLLDIIDKHRLIMPIARQSRFSFFDILGLIPNPRMMGGGTLRDNADGNFEMVFADMPSSEREKLRGVEQTLSIKPDIVLRFGDPPFEDKEILPTLDLLVSAVADAIGRLSAAAAASAP